VPPAALQLNTALGELKKFLKSKLNNMFIVISTYEYKFVIIYIINVFVVDNNCLKYILNTGGGGIKNVLFGIGK
jgi:hypothetical protein